MSRRARALAGALLVALHLAILAPLANNDAAPVEFQYLPIGEGVLDGAKPYVDLDFEYPPFALAVMAGPAAVTDDPASYAELFSWEMIVADLAIVLMLALCVPGGPREVWAALAVYTAGIVLLGLRARSGLDFGMSAIVLQRFDLFPAALVLAAALARRVGRSATWSALLSLGAAVKAFPAALFPVLVRGERRTARVVIAALIPLAGAAVLVLALGDRFWSAIAYHADRDLQIETVGASLVLIADHLGGTASTVFGAGSLNVNGTGADFLRTASVVAMLACYALVVRHVWTRRIGALESTALVLAPLIVLAPILSPQFLIWLLPVSAAAYGLRAPNLVLVAACGLTGIELSHYDQARELGPEFVGFVLARNGLLLVYLALVLAPIFRRAPMPMPTIPGHRLSA